MHVYTVQVCGVDGTCNTYLYAMVAERVHCTAL